MTHDQDQDEATGAVRRDDGGFAEFAALLLLVSDAGRFDSAMAALQARLSAAVTGAEELAARRQSLQADHALALTKHAEAEAELDTRLNAVLTAQKACDTRLARIRELHEAWRFIGETATVMSGLQSPRWSPLDKALAAHGRAPRVLDDGPSHGRPETIDETEPAPGRQEGSTLTHRSPKPRRSETVRGAH